MNALVPATPTWVDRSLWPFPPRAFHGPEGRLHYVDEGQGPPVLLVHGTPSWSIDWRHLIRGLAPQARCIAVDHLGFGLSDRPHAAGYTPEDHARRFAAFADALDLHDLTLVVHDFGGPIALPWAVANAHRLRRVVVVNSWAWSVQDDPRMRLGARLLGSALGRVLYRWLNLSLRVIAPSAWGDRRKLTPALQAQLLAPFPHRDERGEVLWTLARALLASSAHYAHLEARLGALRDVPMGLVWGMADTAFTPDHLARWLRLRPDAEVLRVPGAGHWPHEEEPELVLRWMASRL